MPGLMLMLLFTACADSDSFRLNGEIDTAPTMNLRVVYYADGALRTAVTAAREGEFEIYGSSRYPTVAEIYDYENHLLARTYLVNGQNVKLKITQGNRYLTEASGSDVASRWAEALKDNADSLMASPAAANNAIAAYVRAHPSDVVSTLMLVYDYHADIDPRGADELMQSIDAPARPAALTEGFNYQLQPLIASTAADSIPDLILRRKGARTDTLRPRSNPYTLIAIVRDNPGRRDSVIGTLRRLKRSYGRNLEVWEISTDPDTGAWLRSIHADSARWEQAWTAAGVAGRGVSALGVPDIPYFIVCDSTARPLFRGVSTRQTESFIRSLLQ